MARKFLRVKNGKVLVSSGSAPASSSTTTGEPIIAPGLVTQYWRGDKTWQLLDKAAVGLALVDNTADSTKVVLSASKLTTARTINGVAFDGTTNITLPAQTSVTGNAGTATKLQTARTINGVSFDGTANITIPGTEAWPILIATNTSGGTTTANSFVTITFPTVVLDSHNAFASGIYTIPTTGVYDILVKFRLTDFNFANGSYGLGAHTSNADGVWFSWFGGNANRQGATYRRIASFTQGDAVRAFYYLDGVAPNFNYAEIAIIRIR